MYRSFIKGPNPWARSSAFTQKIQNTRGAYMFYQNAFDSPMGGQPGVSAAEQRKREEELKNNKKRLKEKLKKKLNYKKELEVHKLVLEV